MRACGNPTIVLGTILMFLSAQVHASTNVRPVPSEQEVFGTCPALDRGMLQRLGDAYSPLEKQFNAIVDRLGERAIAKDMSRRLKYSQCSWLRNVATRCLEPTSHGHGVVSPVDRLAENVAIGKVWEDLEDDCMRERLQTRIQVLEKLGNSASASELSAAIEALIPPPGIFGTFAGPAHHECRIGDPQTTALDPNFDDWVDCSQWSDELHLSTSLEDSLSGIDVWLGVPMDHGDDHTLAGSTVYEPAASSLEVDDYASGCALTLTVNPEAVEVRPNNVQSQCMPPADAYQPQITALQRFQRVAAEPPLWGMPQPESKNFLSNGRPARVWVDSNAVVSVAFVLGLNRSLQVSSNCANLPAYEELVDFFDRYRTAVVAKDMDALAKLTGFPLQVNAAATEFIADTAHLKARFDSVFPMPLFAVMRDLDSHFVYCSHGRVMVAAGRIWAKPDASGALRVYFVDSHAHTRATPKDIVPN
jgi:hypothetical protein